MEYKNEHQRQIAILEAAMPYVAPNSRYAIQLLLQADTFVNLARYGGSDNDLEAAEAGAEAAPFQPNPQEMLLNIQRFLTPRESDTVQTILNFMNARRLFQNYNEFVRERTGDDASPDLSAASVSGQSNPLQVLFQLINGLGSLGQGLGASSTSDNPAQNPQNNLLQDFLLSQLEPEQKQTFEQLKNIMYNKNK